MSTFLWSNLFEKDIFLVFFQVCRKFIFHFIRYFHYFHRSFPSIAKIFLLIIQFFSLIWIFLLKSTNLNTNKLFFPLLWFFLYWYRSNFDRNNVVKWASKSGFEIFEILAIFYWVFQKLTVRWVHYCELTGQSPT